MFQARNLNGTGNKCVINILLAFEFGLGKINGRLGSEPITRLHWNYCPKHSRKNGQIIKKEILMGKNEIWKNSLGNRNDRCCRISLIHLPMEEYRRVEYCIGGGGGKLLLMLLLLLWWWLLIVFDNPFGSSIKYVLIPPIKPAALPGNEVCMCKLFACNKCDASWSNVIIELAGISYLDKWND